MMASFVVEQRRNGLMNPDGFYSQHRPEMITEEDYLSGRWIAKPAQPLRQRPADHDGIRHHLHHR